MKLQLMGNVCHRRFAWLVLPIILLPLCLGCGDGRETRVPVSGMVTVDGEPLKYGSITFMPVKTPGAASRPGGGSLEDGRFSVSSYTANDGLLKGKYEVMVNACLLYTSPSPRDLSTSRMPSSA